MKHANIDTRSGINRPRRDPDGPVPDIHRSLSWSVYGIAYIAQILIFVIVICSAFPLFAQHITAQGQHVDITIGGNNIGVTYADQNGDLQESYHSASLNLNDAKFEAWIRSLEPGTQEFLNVRDALGICPDGVCFDTHMWVATSYDMGCGEAPNPSYYNVPHYEIECIVGRDYSNGGQYYAHMRTLSAWEAPFHGLSSSCTVTNSGHVMRWFYGAQFSHHEEPYNNAYVYCDYTPNVTADMLADEFAALEFWQATRFFAIAFPEVVDAPDIFDPIDIAASQCPNGWTECHHGPDTGWVEGSPDGSSGGLDGEGGDGSGGGGDGSDGGSGDGSGGDGGDGGSCDPLIEICEDQEEEEGDGSPPPSTDHITGAVIDEDEVNLPDFNGVGPVSLAGSCPADVSVAVMGANFAISYQPLCDFASSVSGVIIAIGAMAGFMIATGGSWSRGAS